jgi:hypothetical protein
MLNLAQDNSAAAALYPKNNWFQLTLYLGIIVLLPIIRNGKKGKVFGALFILSFFGSWKHGIAREDIFHMYGLLYFTLASMFIFIVHVKKNYYINVILISIALSLFLINMKNVSTYRSTKVELFGVNNFVTAIKSYPTIIEKSVSNTNSRISVRKLPDEIKETIGQNTVDIYPWDYSIIEANNFNWQPRVVIQSYAAYTSWLDRQNAIHFNSQSAPEFLIWHTVGSTNELGNLNSIDKRYLLNDEPQTIIEILRNYKLVKAYNSFLVYEKRKKPINVTKNNIQNEEVTWNKWIEIPASDNNILRAKIDIKGNFKRNLKSFFYKDESFYVYYKLEDNTIVSKRIVPKNATDGLWINPYIQYPGSGRTPHPFR